jgi:flavin reductase (DIM6/NTAB) family NADH-FMN oxidoreductase RutF
MPQTEVHGSTQARRAGNIPRRGLCPRVRCSRNMDLKAKKETLRLLTNGVYVLTSRNGDDYGVATITWVSQVSFQPPLVMAALRKDGNVFRCLRESGAAVLHVVGSDQKELAQKFFSTTKESNGLLNGEPFTEGKTSAPVLKNLSAYLECKLVDICEDYGDHAIVILEVVEAGIRGTVVPLVVNDSPWKYGG